MTQTIKIRIKEQSYESLVESGYEIEDNNQTSNQFYGDEGKAILFNKLTRRQRTIATLLLEGYKRKEIAKREGICLQSVHQIVIRMRKRLQYYPRYASIQTRNTGIKKPGVSLSSV